MLVWRAPCFARAGRRSLGSSKRCAATSPPFILEETCEITVISVTPGKWKTSHVARTTKLPTRWLKNPLTIHDGSLCSVVGPRAWKRHDS